MENKREIRRHHLKRMKAKARYIAKHSWGYGNRYRDNPLKLKEALDKAEQYANHLKMCSCHMCGNHRKNNGDTLKERAAKNEEKHGH